MSVTWPSVPNKTYRVLYTDTLGAAWQSSLPGSQVTATSAETTYTDSTVTGVSRRFYRVEVVP